MNGRHDPVGPSPVTTATNQETQAASLHRRCSAISYSTVQSVPPTFLDVRLISILQWFTEPSPNI